MGGGLAAAAMASAVVLLELASGRMSVQQGEANSRAAPGSVIKPFVLEAAGSLPPLERICGRRLRLSGRNMDCQHPRLALPLGPREALAYSCNSYFAAAGMRVDPQQLTSTLRQFGFVVSRAPETEAERQLMALGEFGVTTTPPDLARGFARLLAAHPGGVAGLREAVEAGTAQWAAVDGVAVAGKTGTTRSHAWFAGYAPADRPVVVVVVLKAQGTGGSSAAPEAAEALKKWFAQQQQRR